MTKYVLQDDQLYYITIDGALHKGLNQEEAKVLMGEVHEEICGAHQSACTIKWIICRIGYFWPIILEDCFEYYKGCQDCQRFGNIQKSPALAINRIIKPWPFWGWGIDLIGQIFPPSSKGYPFAEYACLEFNGPLEHNFTSRGLLNLVVFPVITNYHIFPAVYSA